MNRPPEPILARYGPVFAGLRWGRAAGGFSGADVWRGEDDTGSPVVALKAWPPGTPAPRLARVHDWMAKAGHLPFVPSVLPTTDGRSFASHDGRPWDLTRWVPGSPRGTPTVADVEAACVAVARLHACWPPTATAPCPAVLNRLRVLADGRALVTAPGHFSPPFAPLLRRACDAVARLGPKAEAALRPWEAVPVPVRPCVRDLRGEHVLFTGLHVTGLVDYGAMAEDHPATDLARMLGDLAPDDDTAFTAGLRAYRVAGGDLAVPDGFVRLLDRTGAVGSVVGWLLRLRGGHGSVPAAADRLARLLDRIERFTAFAAD